MVQQKSKSSASSKETPSSSVQPASSNLTPATTILAKLQRQDGGFYAATLNLVSQAEYFQGGREGDVLIPKNTAGDEELTLRAVFQISRSNFYFTPDANFDPANTMFNGKFADAKLSCHLVPTRHKDFRFSSDDFPAIYDNLRAFEKLIRRDRESETLSAIHTAAGIDSIKLVHHLFTVKPTEESQDQYTVNPQDDDTSSDTATNLGSEFEISNWPVAERCKGHLADLAQTHIVNPLPAYDTDHQLIPPTQYENKLCGAVVEVHFAFFHHHIRRSKRHIFNAVLRELIVLRPPSNMPSSPLKRRNIGAGPASDKPSKGKKRVHTSETV